MLVEMISQQISQLIYNNTVAYWEGISMSTHQEGAKHIKANKVDDSKVAATVFTGMADLCPLLTWAVRRTGQHDFLPCLPCCTPTEMHKLNVRETSNEWKKEREKARGRLTWRAAEQPEETSESCCFGWSGCGPSGQSYQTSVESEKHYPSPTCPSTSTGARTDMETFPWGRWGESVKQMKLGLTCIPMTA